MVGTRCSRFIGEVIITRNNFQLFLAVNHFGNFFFVEKVPIKREHRRLYHN
jgi:hypothetical protein